MDVDPDICADAEAVLKATRFRPRVVCADSSNGHPDHATVQRLIVTCTVHTVPYTWVRHTCGVIATPFGHGIPAGELLRLESDGRTASGREAALGITLKTVPRPRNQKGFVVLPKRWVVENDAWWNGHSLDRTRVSCPARRELSPAA